MTDAQIRFSQLLETRRHNRRTEDLSKYATDVQASTSRYATDVGAKTSMSVAEMNARTQRYVADQSAKVHLTSAQLSAETSRYAADTQAQTSQYRTNVESADRLARLRFDRQTQILKNKFEEERIRLESFKTMNQIRANDVQVRKALQDIENSIAQLELNARMVGLNEEAAKWNNQLTQAKTAEAIMNGVDKGASALNRVLGFIKSIVELGAG